MKPSLHILSLHNIPIYDQLAIEEALLRAGDENYCLFNQGSDPAIVMGLSQRVEDVVVKHETLPIIKRFSGGGCVVVDEKTLFFTLILNKNDCSFDINPTGVLEWTFHMLSPVFLPHTLELHEQDFAISQKKIAGNALCFTEKRVLHHATFLWSFDEKRMNSLQLPKKQPSYRKGRSHEDFCGKLCNQFSSKEAFLSLIQEELQKSFHCKELSLQNVQAIVEKPHRKALQLIG